MDHPRTPLVTTVTPIERLDRLSKLWGIDLHVKRDDLAGGTLGGNKSRQLEYYLGAAVQANADTILITGAVQSNFVRTAAAQAARLGMRCIVQLEQRVPGQDALYASSGNVLLSRLIGAEIMGYPDGEDEAGADAAVRARAEVERARGHTPYVIPLALGNPPLGALGYVRAVEEIVAQSPEPFDSVFVASGSGLTHAGLLMGLHRLGCTSDVIGSCVRRPAPVQRDRIRRVLDDLGDLMGANTVPSDRIEIWDGALSPGYGQISPAGFAAMELAAAQEGLFLDPVYTSKVFAGIPALVDSGRIPKGARVLFVHTGGLASLFAYQTGLDAALAAEAAGSGAGAG